MESFHSLTIFRVDQLAAQAKCFHFAVPAELKSAFRYRPGQYLTLRTTIDDEVVRRSYSICAGPEDEHLSIAIKPMPGGLFSNEACAAFAPGDVVEVMPPDGAFGLPATLGGTKRYLCIAAGSGITPILSIIKSVLITDSDNQLSLIYGNQKVSTMMFRDELCALKNRFMDRFQWTNIFSREAQEAQVLNGRIDNRKGADLIRRHLIRLENFDEFLLCGPEAMISEVSRGLRGEGVEEKRIHYELFYADAHDAARVIAKHHERALKHAGKVCQVEVNIDGRTTLFELGADGGNILDAATAQGLDLPFSCRGGVCATCKARLIDGNVDMDLNHALTQADVDAGLILTCQAHPVSERVVVDFDQT